MQALRLLVLCALALVMALVATQPIVAHKEASRVVELNSDNFEEYVHGPMKHTFVLYCVTWTRQCQTMRTLWDRLSISQSSKELRDVFTAGYVDGDKYPDIIEKMNVQGFPTSIFYTPIYPDGVEYDGSSESYLIDSFVFQFS
ncbi:hypothetical protein ABB37_01989 [Leptomonas pyrrhocoris]|uniref:Thioredoxin domain-containing protein n=1 Tax=Leptomonas pyrrhocoris TaxID=157538 RepID=A0A0M9G6Z7_LEPPY|nr:hypothetical protein ABB37_01989 [Leptomonas pyrrhocoris]KPA83753.1 hypothetical protein ABB37_01989 [Leptomonas pyrrhocoris]|eukprot:XP_015662192.1 hypothetical protein ABB37_01989 [Leptomonas pyrrhocoris]